MDYRSLPDISAFLAKEWFREASRRALPGNLSSASLLVRPSVGGNTWHPIVTWEPSSYEGFLNWAPISPAMSERQAASFIHESLQSAPIF